MVKRRTKHRLIDNKPLHTFLETIKIGNLSHLLPGRKIQNTIKAETDVHNHEMTVTIEINIRNSRAKETLDF